MGLTHLAGVYAGELDRMNSPQNALQTGVVVADAQPFTRQGIGRLDKEAWAPPDEVQRKLHEELIDLRNKRFAHTDKGDFRGVEDVFRDGTFAEWTIHLNEGAWAAVAELADARRHDFGELANRLQDELRAASETEQ